MVLLLFCRGSCAFRYSVETFRRPGQRAFFSTQYTIDEPGVEIDVLEKTVAKHWECLPRFLSEKPVAAHTKEAFSQLMEQLRDNSKPIILDRYESSNKDA